jgi:hypothetical protein
VRDTSNAAAARRASDDCAPPRLAITAPAPSQSSIAKRVVPSGQRSPAATTPIGPSHAASHRATAGALRSDATIAGRAMRVAAATRLAPLSDGSTRRVPFSMSSSDSGDRLNIVRERSVQRIAFSRRAKSAAPAAAPGQG